MPSKKGIGGHSVVQRFVAWGFATSAAVLLLGWTGACGSNTGISKPEADAQAVDAPVASGGAAGAASDAAAAGSGGHGTGGIVGSGGVTASGGIASTGGTNVADGATPIGGSTVAGGATPSGGSTVAGGATRTGGSTVAGGATPIGGSTGVGGATPTGGFAGAGGTKSSAGGTGGIACTDCSPLDAGCTGDGCSRDADSTGGMTCENSGVICATTGGQIQACCSSTQCKYVVSGRDFNCNGTDCTSEASAVVSYCECSGCSQDAGIDVAQSSGDAPIGTEHPDSSGDTPIKTEGPDASSALYDACVLSCQNERLTAFYPGDAGPVSCARYDYGSSCSTSCAYDTCLGMTSYQCTRFTSGLALNCPEKLLAFYICAVSGTWTCIEYSQGYYISQPPNGCSRSCFSSDGG